jgi:hypothetical protein
LRYRPENLNNGVDQIFVLAKSGGELLKIQLLDNHLLDTFGSKSTARLEIDQLLESSKTGINLIRTDDKNIVNWSNQVFI